MKGTMNVIKVTMVVDIPPTTNHLYSSIAYFDAKSGKHRCRRVLSAEGRNYKEVIGWQAKINAGHSKWEYSGGRIHFEIGIAFPDRRRRDITNRVKVLEDGIAEALGFDDSVVDSFHISRLPNDKMNPHVRVLFYETET